MSAETDIQEQKRFESVSEPGVFFWAQRQEPTRGVGPVCWIVVSGGAGVQTTEAHDDWLCSESDALEIAAMLAKGEAVE